MKTVLILCTGNSARSILAECLINRLGASEFHAVSAGSMPAGQVNPLALELLDREGFDTGGLRSKSWDEFDGRNAETDPIDIVITVCDSAAAETCPVWPGAPLTAHWGIPDPAAVTGDRALQRAAFDTAYKTLTEKIARFVNLPWAQLDKNALHDELRKIGET